MHDAALSPLHLPEPGALSATIAGVPIETFLAPSGTGGGRRRAGLRGVADLLGGMGIHTVGLVVAGNEDPKEEKGGFACTLPALGGTMAFTALNYFLLLCWAMPQAKREVRWPCCNAVVMLLCQ